jgi:hypothetical protein
LLTINFIVADVMSDDMCSCLCTVQPYLEFTCPLCRQAPCLHRQGLNPHHRRLDVKGKCHCTHNNTQDVYNVVPIRGDVADTAAVNATMLVWLKCAREGLSDKITLEQLRFGRESRWHARGVGEHVDELKNEETGECATKVGDPRMSLAYGRTV